MRRPSLARRAPCATLGVLLADRRGERGLVLLHAHARACRRRRRGCAPRAGPRCVALPTATVATGMPAGICTIDSSESRPSRCCERHRHADHRQRRHRRGHARQVGGAAGAGDDHLEAPVGRAPARSRTSRRACGGPRRCGPRTATPNSVEHVDRALHHGQVGVAAHDHADERSASRADATDLTCRPHRGAHAHTTDRDARHRAPRDARRHGRRLLPRARRRGVRGRRLRHASARRRCPPTSSVAEMPRLRRRSPTSRSASTCSPRCPTA